MRITSAAFFSAIVAVIAMSSTPPVKAAASCESLAALALPNAKITSAQTVAAGGFTPPGRGGAASGAATLPSFCRVMATLAPSADSDIKIEVWLPTSGWNGKLLSVGNGGWTGSISYAAMGDALGARGYATASTDTGHDGGSGQFALGHPEKLVDFGWRAVHEMTVKSKAVVDAFYGRAPERTYWAGCSSGGKQGLKEAQKFPEDYDGIVAGAPANYWTHLVTQSLWAAQATLKDPASAIPRDKYAVIHDAAVARCDASDGVRDGVIEDPSRCQFDPKTLLCSNGDGPSCLTAPQVAAAQKIYAPARNPRTGQEIFPGLAIGSEMGWAALAGGPRPLSIADDHYKFVVFKNPDWDFRTLDFDRDLELADRIDRDFGLNANDPDLREFAGRGGKIVMYHGWNDQLIAPASSINYLKSVEKALGSAKTSDLMRLFMVPGMTHCAGGDGTASFDMLKVLEQWVEQKQPPQRIVASRFENNALVRTRPLCPYPQIARYSGTGSTDDAANFACQVP